MESRFLFGVAGGGVDAVPQRPLNHFNEEEQMAFFLNAIMYLVKASN